MATVTRDGDIATAMTTVGELPEIGSPLPSFTLAGIKLGDVDSASFAVKRVVLNIFPSVDTGICSLSGRRFNKLASQWDNTVVVCISVDLPFALSRFCAAEGIDNVVAASAFRSDFGEKYGVTLVDGPMRGLLARSVVIADETGKIVYTRLSPVIGEEPDYAEAEAAVLG